MKQIWMRSQTALVFNELKLIILDFHYRLKKFSICVKKSLILDHNWLKQNHNSNIFYFKIIEYIRLKRIVLRY